MRIADESIGEVRVLGEIAAYTNDSAVDLPGSRTRELLAALAQHPGKKATREYLYGTIWPDSPEVSARKALNTELWRLRTAIRESGGEPDQWIDSSTVGVRLRCENGLHVDLARFRTSLDVRNHEDSLADLMESLKLYRGDFALGLDSEWITMPRHQLRRQFVQILNRAIQQSREAKLLDQAAFLAERLVTEEPFDERGHRAFLLARIQSGDHAAAVRHYQELCRVFKTELGIEPSPETRALVDALWSEPTGSPRDIGSDSQVEPRAASDRELRERIQIVHSAARSLLKQVEGILRDIEGP